MRAGKRQALRAWRRGLARPHKLRLRGKHQVIDKKSRSAPTQSPASFPHDQELFYGTARRRPENPSRQSRKSPHLSP
jgi:hypothetical protein